MATTRGHIDVLLLCIESRDSLKDSLSCCCAGLPLPRHHVSGTGDHLRIILKLFQQLERECSDGGRKGTKDER
jgi:hypothetical protein